MSHVIISQIYDEMYQFMLEPIAACRRASVRLPEPIARLQADYAAHDDRRRLKLIASYEQLLAGIRLAYPTPEARARVSSELQAELLAELAANELLSLHSA